MYLRNFSGVAMILRLVDERADTVMGPVEGLRIVYDEREMNPLWFLFDTSDEGRANGRYCLFDTVTGEVRPAAHEELEGMVGNYAVAGQGGRIALLFHPEEEYRQLLLTVLELNEFTSLE